jgi:hypothetical protein
MSLCEVEQRKRQRNESHRKSQRFSFKDWCALNNISEATGRRIPSQEDASSAKAKGGPLSTVDQTDRGQTCSNDQAGSAVEYKFNLLVLAEIQAGADKDNCFRIVHGTCCKSLGMDAMSPKREGLLHDYLSEAELTAELDKDIRTLQRWRKLRIGPPFVTNGLTPIYNIDKARQWLPAGGTAGVRRAPLQLTLTEKVAA